MIVPRYKRRLHMRSFATLLGCGIVAAMLSATAEGGDFAERLDASFVLSRRDSIIGAAVW